jgi:NIPSNAP
MLYDMRSYDLRPGALQAYMDAVREVALPVRQRYGIKLAGWYYTEVGTLNRVVHIWAFRDWQHLAEGKRGFRADPQWKGAYLPRVLPLIVRQHSQIMLAADFSPQPG